MLLHYLCSSLLLLFRFTHGEIGSVGSACGILSGPSSHSILSSVFTPCSFHNPDVRLSTLPHLWYVLILSHLTRHIPPLAFSSCCHPSLYPTEEGGKGGEKKKKHYSHLSHTIILHFRSLSNPISPSFTFYPPPPPPPAPHSFDLLEWLPSRRAFAAATLCHSWNCVATIAWLGLALVANRAFYDVFASPSQDILSGLWGGCSFTFH